MLTPSMPKRSARTHAISQSMSYLWFIITRTCSFPTLFWSLSSMYNKISLPDHHCARNISSVHTNNGQINSAYSPVCKKTQQNWSVYLHTYITDWLTDQIIYLLVHTTIKQIQIIQSSANTNNWDIILPTEYLLNLQ